MMAYLEPIRKVNTGTCKATKRSAITIISFNNDIVNCKDTVGHNTFRIGS
jgi:hypothetical protein